jgi:hypothetical protein
LQFSRLSRAPLRSLSGAGQGVDQEDIVTGIEKLVLRAERVQTNLMGLRTNLPDWSDEARPRLRDELLRQGRSLDTQIVWIDSA